MKEMERICNTHVSVRKTYTLVQKHARERFRRVWNDNIKVYINVCGIFPFYKTRKIF